MKFLPAQFAFVLHEGDTRGNLKALAMYLLFLSLVIALYTVVFHWIMGTVEGQRHSTAPGRTSC